MLPGNVDPRRPDKVQRYVPKTNNANGQEDLTTDYMNILGQHPTTANASDASDKHAETSVSTEVSTNQVHGVLEEVHPVVADELALAANMIPTSSQYGVAIIPNPTAQDTENSTPTVESVTDAIMKPDDTKDLHSTPSRNDRFKVVKIASLEPFKRGRWKCMDYVDDTPPVTAQSKVVASQGSIQVAPGGVYLQTQSLPQQQFQQMLLQGGFTNGTQFFSNVPAQIVPQGQYFYPQMNAIQSQALPSQQQVPTSMPIQFNAGQTYFPAGVIPNAAGFATAVPPGYTNVQYVPANLVQNQNSAFVPTSQQTVQLPANFQQSQTYAGPPNVTQSNLQSQPLVNGHAYPTQQQNEQQNTTAASLPSQTAKSIILNNSVSTQPSNVSQNQINQQQSTSVPNQMVSVAGNSQSQTVATVQQPQQQPQQQNYQPNTFQQQVANQQSQNQNNPPNITSVVQAPTIIQVSQVVPGAQNFDQNLANNVYTNPQFAMSVNSLTVLDNNDASVETINESGSGGGGGGETTSENTDDVAKTNPVVNAIDNKIEQAMDLVKSHLMYTVREEVEVLKEKITELLDRIQQLENENSFLRQQIPKNQNITIPTVASTSNTNTTAQNSLAGTNVSGNLTTQSTAAVPSSTSSLNPVTNSGGAKGANEANSQQ